MWSFNEDRSPDSRGQDGGAKSPLSHVREGGFTIVTIWKFPLNMDGRCVVVMPKGAEVLCVQVQDGVGPCIWARVDPDADRTYHAFGTYGTGHQHRAINDKYIGTYQLSGGRLIYHVFDEGEIPLQ